MNREIKFRAWDKTHAKWFHPTYEFYKGKLQHLVLAIDTGELLTIKLEGRKLVKLSDNQQYELEQFTGLKDKNGVDIYEGDFLKFKYPFNNNNEISLVEWSGKDAGFILGISTLWKIAVKAEVIGNVHENPELLEADK